MINIKIAAATLNQTPIHWKRNYENIAKSIKEAKSKNVNILCLPSSRKKYSRIHNKIQYFLPKPRWFKIWFYDFPKITTY